MQLVRAPSQGRLQVLVSDVQRVLASHKIEIFGLSPNSWPVSQLQSQGFHVWRTSFSSNSWLKAEKDASQAEKLIQKAELPAAPARITSATLKKNTADLFSKLRWPRERETGQRDPQATGARNRTRKRRQWTDFYGGPQSCHTNVKAKERPK